MTGLKMIYLTWRVCEMYKETMGFMKGIGMGLAAGVAVASIGSRTMKNNKRLKRTANKAMRRVNGMLDNVDYIFK